MSIFLINPYIYQVTDIPVDRIANTEAMSFNGTDQYINVGDSNNFSFGNGATDSPFSVSAWANIDSLSNFTILTKGVYSSTGEWHVRMTGSNQMHLVLYDGTAYQACIINQTLNTGQWYHFVFTYNGVGGASANSGIIGYLNGSVAALSRVSSGTYQAMTNTVSPLYIAKNSNNYSNGKLDEVAIFNTALSASKIQEIYDATAVVDGVPQTANLFTGGLSSSLVYWNRMGDS